MDTIWSQKLWVGFSKIRQVVVDVHGNSSLQELRTADHAVPICKNSQPVNITFSVSKYASGTLGQFLSKVRLEKRLELKQLAKRLRVQRNTVYDWENDRNVPSIKNMERLARFFRVSAKSLEDLKMERKKVFEKG